MLRAVVELLQEVVVAVDVHLAEAVRVHPVVSDSKVEVGASGAVIGSFFSVLR